MKQFNILLNIYSLFKIGIKYIALTDNKFVMLFEILNKLIYIISMLKKSI